MASVHEAAERNDVETLRRLLDEEPELMEAEESEWSCDRPLHSTIYSDSVGAAYLLLDRGAEVNSRGRGGETPLMRACKWGRVEMVAVLLARGADPTMTSPSDRYTALMYASFGTLNSDFNYVAVIRLLLKDGRVPVDARDVNGATALWRTCYYGHIDRARALLLEGHADATITDERRVTPIDAAGRHRHHGCVQLLQWYKHEPEKPFLLDKARAVVDATESIKKAPEKVGAKTEEEADKARKEAAPAYLRRRVAKGKALPCVKVVKEQWTMSVTEEEEERGAVVEFVVTMLKEDLYLELMEGLRLRSKAVGGAMEGARGGRRGGREDWRRRYLEEND